MKGSQTKIKEFVRSLTKASDEFTISNGFLLENEKNVVTADVHFQQQDLVNKSSRKYSNVFTLFNSNDKDCLNNFELRDQFPVEKKDVVMQTLSPCGKKMAIIREDKSSEKKSYFIDVWNKNRIETSVPTGDLHGPIYSDSLFGCLSWSKDGLRLVYAAEKKPLKTESFFEYDFEKEKKEDMDESMPGLKFKYKQDWGELFGERCVSCLYVLDLNKKKITLVQGIPDHVAAGDAHWSPNGEELIFTGVPIPDRRLGLIYCFNRKKNIYSIPFTSPLGNDNNKSENDLMNNLTPTLFTSRSPRFSPDGKNVAFLYTKEGLTHNTCHYLAILNWDTKVITTVVDSVQDPKKDEFPGLYTLSLLKRCWSNNDKVVINTQWRSSSAIVLVDINTKTIERLELDNISKDESLVAYDANKNDFLIGHSSPSSPPSPVLVRLGENRKIDYRFLSETKKIAIDWKVLEVPVKESEASSFEIILNYPSESENKSLPLIVFPHGGPHSVYANEWKATSSYLCSLGFMICYVNYRGSTGFGMQFLECLLGKVGRQDIDDVQAARDFCCQNLNVDNTKVAFIGGSHGGWLGAHAITQFPNDYQAAVLHNPVINLVEEVSTSDIPDWVYAEAGVEFKSHLHEEDLMPLYKKSPISQDMNKVKTPTLFKLGAKDKRVPASQGLQMHFALQAAGVKSEVFWYPNESHPIDSVEANSDSWIHIASWLHDHLEF